MGDNVIDEAPPSEVKIGTLSATVVSGALAALEYARSIRVVSGPTYELAANEVKSLKVRRDAIEAERVALKAPILEATRKLDAFFKRATDPLDEAIGAVKLTMTTYDQEERRKADEAQRAQEEEARKARLEADRKAAEVRAKAEAEARVQREEAERRKREADEAARNARDARERGDLEAAEKAERERRVAEEAQRSANSKAAKAEEKGEQKAQDAYAAAAEIAAKPPAVAEAPRAKGVSIRMRRSAIVQDLKKLVDAVSAGTTPVGALMADQKVLNKAAEALGPDLEKFYPGVAFHETPELAVSSKR